MGNLVLSPDENGKFSIMQASCKNPKYKSEIGGNVNLRTDGTERKIKVYLSMHSLSFIYTFFK